MTLSADRTTTLGALRWMALAGSLIVSSPVLVTAQPVVQVDAAVTLDPMWHPITPQERKDWVVEGIVAPKSLASSLMVGSWQTAIDSPREWQGSSGFTKRVLTNEADMAISMSVEASLGMIWGEDPRPTPSRRRGFGGRLGYAMGTVVLAPRRDGHLAPAWGRVAGVVGSNVVKNAWLPSRLTTPKETAGRIAGALLGRLATNLWGEFGPDLRRRFSRGRTTQVMATKE